MKLFVLFLTLSVGLKSQCDLTRYTDKFTGNVSITGDLDGQVSFAKFIIKSDTSYHLCLKASSSEGAYNKKGVIVLIENSYRIDRPEEIVKCKMKSSDYFTYTAMIRLTKPEIEILSKNLITDFRLYYTDKVIHPDLAAKYKEELECLFKE